MKRGFVSLVVGGALALCSLAFAAPQPLTTADLDQVVAGAAGALLDNAVAAGGENSANSAVGALAETGAAAVNGNENVLDYTPDDSAIAYDGSQSISAGNNGEGLALAVADSMANYSDDPTDSAVNLGTDNTAMNFASNDDVANASGEAIALGDVDDAATAVGAKSLAFEANDDVAVAECGTSIGDAEYSATNIGYGNIAIEGSSDVVFATDYGMAIEDASDVVLAQDCGLAVYNDGQAAITASGIAIANPDDTALAYGDGSIALEDPYDVAIADHASVAVTSGLDAMIADEHSQAFDENYNVANATGSGPAIASDGNIALATGESVAIAIPDNTNVAIHGNAAKSTSNGQAVAGDGNKSIYQDANTVIWNPSSTSENGYSSGNALAAMDHAVVDVSKNSLDYTTIDNGSAAIIGNENQVSTVFDDAEIYLYSDDDDIEVEGVFGKNVEICGSFNTDKTEIDVEATISESFNVESNTICISGQNAASGIALVNALGDPETAINLNVTSASATVPVVNASSAPALSAGISFADTQLTQASLNSSYALTITF